MPKTKRIAEVRLGDCKDILAGRQYAGQVNLAVCDPPYNLGQKYASYDDKKTVDEYLAWAECWLAAVAAAMVKNGSLWLFINDGLVSEMDVLCKRLGLHRRGWVVWHYTFGQNQQNNFTPSHTHLLYYVRDPQDFTFNKEDILVPSARQLKYKDKRANPKGRLPDNTWVLFPEQLPEAFNPAGDVWLQSRVCGTFHERREHSPNQLPLPILERIVLACSKPDDLVADPFCGTGGLAAVCLAHRRQYLGCDIDATCVERTKARLEAHD